MTDSNNQVKRSIPDEAFWQVLIDAYKHVKKDSDRDDAALFQALETQRCGFQIAFEARHVPGKGRGIVATEPIAKGTTVLNDRNGKFRTEQEWRAFLTLLPKEMALDAVDWACVDEYKRGKEALYLGFCDSNLLNHGYSKKSLRLWERLFPCVSRRKVTANLKDQETKDGSWSLVASRDIEAGEELLLDYNQCGSGYDHGLPWFDAVYAEYYPGQTVKGELERWQKGGICKDPTNDIELF